MHGKLRAAGHRCGRHRVARIMRNAGLRPRQRPRRRPRTTDSRRVLPVAPDVLGQQFTVQTPDRVWLGDTSRACRPAGVALLGRASRPKVVGWARDRVRDRTLALRVPEMPLERRSPGLELLHRSDRGSQYVSIDDLLRLEAGAALQHEHRRWRTRDEARVEVLCIEGCGNLRRRHSSLGYRP